jgi:hypothetical protein
LRTSASGSAQIVRTICAEPEADVTSQDLLAVLGDPHQVELDVEAGMGGPSVVFHPANVLEVVA